MGEISDLIGIYGAIDRAVAGGPKQRDRVARLLPVYEHPDLHWFDEFEAWTIERRREESDEPPFPSLEPALHDLADIEPGGRMRARRLMAIALAVQAVPQLADTEEGRLAAAGALGVRGLADDPERGRELLRLLADEELLPDVDDRDPDALWDDLLREGGERGLIDDPASMGPRPCSGRLVMVDVLGQEVPVATLTAGFETSLVGFDQAIRFLRPENWLGCSDFWCEMTPVGAAGVDRYHEKVSTDCVHEDVAWTIQAELDFAFRRIADVVAIAEYKMSPGLPQPDVLVDEGSLVVHEIGVPGAPRIRVTTTKRIRFNYPFSGEQLAMIMCALGYAYVVEDLVFTCAHGAKGPGTPFPGEPSAKKQPAGAPDCGPLITAFADEAATSIQACIDDWAQAAGASSKKIAEGRYTADALVQDMAGMWSRVLREGATAADVAARGAGMAARTAPRGRRRARP